MKLSCSDLEVDYNDEDAYDHYHQHDHRNTD